MVKHLRMNLVLRCCSLVPIAEGTISEQWEAAVIVAFESVLNYVGLDGIYLAFSLRRSRYNIVAVIDI